MSYTALPTLLLALPTLLPRSPNIAALQTLLLLLPTLLPRPPNIAIDCKHCCCIANTAAEIAQYSYQNLMRPQRCCQHCYLSQGQYHAKITQRDELPIVTVTAIALDGLENIRPQCRAKKLSYQGHVALALVNLLLCLRRRHAANTAANTATKNGLNQNGYGVIVLCFMIMMMMIMMMMVMMMVFTTASQNSLCPQSRLQHKSLQNDDMMIKTLNKLKIKKLKNKN